MAIGRMNGLMLHRPVRHARALGDDLVLDPPPLAADDESALLPSEPGPSAAVPARSGDAVPEPPSATGQYPDPVWADAVPEPPSATGQYPAPLWGGAGEARPGEALGDDIPEPPSATGQYPGPVWANGEAQPPAAGATEQTASNAAAQANEGSEDESVPEPPAATGQYPGEIWQDAGAPHGSPGEPAAPGGEKGHALLLDNPAIYRIVRRVAQAHSGTDLYRAVVVDAVPGEGLAFGLLLFTQGAGHLGSLLRLMQRRDPVAFAVVFGPAWPELLAVTGAAVPARRLAPVAGEALSGPGWVARFREAGTLPVCQAAQNEEAIEGLFRPMLPVVLGLGFTTDRALALAFECVVTHGLERGLRWIERSAGVLNTPEQRAFALEVLGYPTLQAFQQATGNPLADGRLDGETHAALAGALRHAGRVPLPTPGDLIGRLVAAAAGPARARLLALRDADGYADTAYREI